MFLADQIAGFFDQQDFQKKWIHLSDFWKGVKLSKKEEIEINFVGSYETCPNAPKRMLKVA